MYSGAASNKCRTSAPTAISAYHRRYELIVVVAGSRRVCLSFQRRSISDLDDKEGLARQWSLVFGGAIIWRMPASNRNYRPRLFDFEYLTLAQLVISPLQFGRELHLELVRIAAPPE
jgi:hypothetical protein